MLKVATVTVTEMVCTVVELDDPIVVGLTVHVMGIVVVGTGVLFGAMMA